jgi:hypothetical protein
MKDKIINLYNNIKNNDPIIAKKIIFKASKILTSLDDFIKEIKGDYIYIDKREIESLVDSRINFPTDEIGDIGVEK